jgi:hypothetical protein
MSVEIAQSIFSQVLNGGSTTMSNWFFSLPIFPQMALVVFGIVYFVSACLFWLVGRLARAERTYLFKDLSGDVLGLIGVLFALLLVFSAEPAWTNLDRAKAAVNSEASALRDVMILAKSLPNENETQFHKLIGKYIEVTVNQEWPAMATKRMLLLTHNVCECSPYMTNTILYMRSLRPTDYWQRLNQSDIVSALEKVREARRERIVISEDESGTLRMIGLLVLAMLLQFMIAGVHAHNRYSGAIAISVSATAIAMSMLLIFSNSSPFGGYYAVSSKVIQEIR